MKLVLGTHPSPLGPIAFALADGALAALDFEGAPELRPRMVRRFGRLPEADREAERAVTERLDRYFAGELSALDDLAVDAEGTPFQRRVWAALRLIPAGETRSYGELARALGDPGAVRAVGAANGKNPVGLVVPCHRVIGSDGSLTGYAGGVWRKEWLLAHERVRAG